MTKFIISLSRTILIAALASGFTLYFTWTIVHTYVDKLIASFNLPVEGSLVQFSDLVGSVANDWDMLTAGANSGKGAAHDMKAEEPVEPKDRAANGETAGADPEDMGATSDGTGEDSEDTSAKKDGEEVSDNDAVPVFGQGGSRQEAHAGRENVLLSPEELAMKKDNLNEEDKKKIFSFISSLPAEDLQKISVMMEGGITKEELAEVQSIVENTLKPEQYDQLMEILQKY